MSEDTAAGPNSSRQRFGMLWYWLVLTAILVFTFWPLVSVMIASGVADANNCAVDEGSVHPCMIAGSDWGGTLYTMGVVGWFMLLTFPAGGLAFFAWLGTLVVHGLVWRRRQQHIMGANR